jgi:L-gulonolactone oxidase
MIDLVELAKQQHLSLKVVGASHSYSDIHCADGGLLINLDQYSRILEVDYDERTVTTESGIRIRDLNAALAQHNLALPTLGAIDEQSIAGAISTATHGSSAHYGSLSSRIVSLRLILANATTVEVSADNLPDLFHATSVGVGSVAVISTITLQCENAFDLEVTTHSPLSMQQYLSNHQQWVTPFDYALAVWYPYTGLVQPITMRKIHPGSCPPRPTDLFGDLRMWTWRIFEFSLLKLEARMPSLTKVLNNWLVWAHPKSQTCGSHFEMLKVYCPSGYSTDSEFFVSFNATTVAYQAVTSALEHHAFNLNAFLVLRFLKGDDHFLSQCGTNELCTAMSFYLLFQNEPNQAFLQTIGENLSPYAAKPHLGKMSPFQPSDVRRLYGASMEKFCHVRQQVDPHGMFLNSYTQHLFST